MFVERLLRMIGGITEHDGGYCGESVFEYFHVGCSQRPK